MPQSPSIPAGPGIAGASELPLLVDQGVELVPPPVVAADSRMAPKELSSVVALDVAAPPVVSPPPILSPSADATNQDEQEQSPTPYYPWWLPTRREMLSGLLSTLFHAVLFVILAAIVGTSGSGGGRVPLNASFSDASDGLASSPDEFLIAEPSSVAKQAAELEHINPASQPEAVPQVALSPEQLREAAAAARLARSRAARPSDIMEPVGAGREGLRVDVPGGFGARSQRLQGREAGGGAGGGLRGGSGPSDASEEAVERALRWLAAHQLEDGSWSFNHTTGLCQGLCGNPGSHPTKTGATGIALLPFLGAGYTHKRGQHRDVIRRGLYWLMSHARRTDNGLDLQDGTMYAQGLATIALCEAYGLTGDPAVGEVAQGALDFIVWAQDKKGGGWRYRPGEPGDTTVTGWQLMALKSGQMAGLNVPRSAIYLADHYLTAAQRESGAQYSYRAGGGHRSNTNTAIGLLCRMYTGWKRTHAPLRRGVNLLSRMGPSQSDMYYNYYATQVLFHWGGGTWEPWNRRLRDYLVRTQATAGHQSGSWYFDAPFIGEPGGRLCATALATMILEVYYRHLPLYGSRVFREE